MCISLSEAAERHNDHSLFYTTTYTSIWDADKIYGCACKYGYGGADCSRRICPLGDDPLTTGEVDEIQSVSCICTGCTGTFTLTFRGEATAALAPSATTVEVKTALQALSTIRTVTVTMNGGTTVCGNSGVSTMITFIADSGNLPAIIPTSLLSSGTITVESGRDRLCTSLNGFHYTVL